MTQASPSARDCGRAGHRQRRRPRPDLRPPSSAGRRRRPPDPHRTPRNGSGCSRVEVIVAGLVVGLVGALTFALPGLLAEPGRGRHRPADPGAEDPDQPAVGRRHRDQRLPGRRSRAAGPARGVRPGDDRAASTLIAEAAEAQPADTEALVGAEPATGRATRRRSSRPGPTTGRVCRSAPSTCATPAPSSGRDAMPILDNLVHGQRRPRRATRWTSGSAISFVVVALLGLAAVILVQVWVARRFRRRINVGLLAQLDRPAAHRWSSG